MPSARRPGGQPGNTNALKHGFYARKFDPRQLEDYTRARSVHGLDEEIALLRLVILHLVPSCLPAHTRPPDLAACTALEAALARLSHLLKDQRLLALGAADPADLLASLFASANAGLPFTGIFPPASEPPSPAAGAAGAENLLPSPVYGRGAGGEGLLPSSAAPNPTQPPPGFPRPEAGLQPEKLLPSPVYGRGAGGEGLPPSSAAPNPTQPPPGLPRPEAGLQPAEPPSPAAGAAGAENLLPSPVYGRGAGGEGL